MTAFAAVNLSELQPPDVVETLSFQAIFDAMLADLISRDSTFTALVKSDPAWKILEVAAYREMILRQRVNDAAKAVMLAFAEGADLDQIGANFDVPRLVLDEGDPDALPPVEPTYEDDDAYRARLQLALEGITTAGSEGSYVFHGLSADGDVKDIQAVSPTPGDVTVYVLSHTGDGTASPGLITIVDAALNAEDVRPMTDNVTVESATIVEYAIEAELVMYPGPDSEVVRVTALDALTAYTDSVHKIGYDVTLSGVMAALHQPGVQRAKLIGVSPTPDGEDRLVEVADGEAAYCTAITVTAAVDPDV